MINWQLIGVLVLTVMGGVTIGLVAAPEVRVRARRTFVVVRPWFHPQGLEVLYESRSLKAATSWHTVHRNDYLPENSTLYVYSREYVDDYNAKAMADPKFWIAIEALFKTGRDLDEANDLASRLQAELDGKGARPIVGVDPALTVDLKQTITDTAGLILEEIRRLAEANPVPGVHNVVQATAGLRPDVTEPISREALASAALEANKPPAQAPHVMLPRPEPRTSTKTVVLKFGQDNRLQ